MIRLENADFEREILSSGSCILVPMEVSVAEDGEIDVLVYSFCRAIAEDWLARHRDDPLSDAAVADAVARLTPIMAEMDYTTDRAGKQAYRDYRCTAPDKAKILPDCAIIDTLDGEAWDELDLDEFALDETDPCDRMAVIRRDGKIVCYAGLNDIGEADGLYELTVACEEDWRRQGFAASCVAMLAAYLIRQGEGVKYICAESHVVSQKTAEAAGFVLARRVQPFVCYRNEDEDNNEE